MCRRRQRSCGVKGIVSLASVILVQSSQAFVTRLPLLRPCLAPKLGRPCYTTTPSNANESYTNTDLDDGKRLIFVAPSAESHGVTTTTARVHRNPVPSSSSSSDRIKLALITLPSILMLAMLYQISGFGTWRYYLAGGLCAAISHSVPVPIDVVKTRKQLDPSLEEASFLEVTRTITKQDGWPVLLDGLGPTTVGYMLEGAMKFGVYEGLKPTVTRMLSSHARWNNPWTAFVLCGFVAGLVASTILCPMEALRIRIVSKRRDFGSDGWMKGAYRMVQTEGVGCLTKGLLAMILKQVPYTITKNVSFDLFAKLLYSSFVQAGAQLTPTIKFCVPLLAATGASILSCVSSQPGDMLLSLVNAHDGDKKTTVAVFKKIWRSDRGVRGYFVGMQTRFLHVGVIVTLQLFLYDLIKRVCGIAATGL
jgi:solute carrier family 25 phosphate transporter 3